MNNDYCKKLLITIRSCDFLSREVIDKWEQNLGQIPDSFYPLISRTFQQLRDKMDSLYAQFELSRDEKGDYKRLIRDKTARATRIVEKIKLTSASDVMEL